MRSIVCVKLTLQSTTLRYIFDGNGGQGMSKVQPGGGFHYSTLSAVGKMPSLVMALLSE
jgi:hypothetical protein